MRSPLHWASQWVRSRRWRRPMARRRAALSTLTRSVRRPREFRQSKCRNAAWRAKSRLSSVVICRRGPRRTRAMRWPRRWTRAPRSRSSPAATRTPMRFQTSRSWQTASATAPSCMPRQGRLAGIGTWQLKVTLTANAPVLEQVGGIRPAIPWRGRGAGEHDAREGWRSAGSCNLRFCTGLVSAAWRCLRHAGSRRGGGDVHPIRMRRRVSLALGREGQGGCILQRVRCDR